MKLTIFVNQIQQALIPIAMQTYNVTKKNLIKQYALKILILVVFVVPFVYTNNLQTNAIPDVQVTQEIILVMKKQKEKLVIQIENAIQIVNVYLFFNFQKLYIVVV